jgi:O-antigen/teichoic acid export membrane protein
MNSRKSVVTFASQLIILAVGIVSNKLTFSVLSPEQYGVFGYAVSSAALFLLFGDLQLQSVFFKRIAEGQDLRRHFACYMFLKLILAVTSLIVFAGYAGYTLLASAQPDVLLVMVLCIVILSCMVDVYTGTLGVIFQARREVNRAQLVAMITAVFNFFYIATLVYATRNLYVFSLALVARSVLGGVVSYLFVKDEISLFRVKYDPGIARDYFHFIIPLLPVTILGTLYDKLDAVLVTNFISVAEAGYFVAAQKFNALLLLPSASIMTILYSSFSESAASRDFSSVQATSNKATKYISLIVTMLSIYIFFNTRDFVILFMSAEYVPTIPIIKVFMLQVILMSVSRTVDSITLAAERLRFLAVFASLSYVLGIGLNLVLIPSELFGFPMFGLEGVGPALKSLLVYVFSIVTNAVYLYVRLGIKIYWRFLYHLGAALGAGYIVRMGWVWNTSNIVSALAVRFVCYLALYIGFMLMVREIKKDDIRYFARVFHFSHV